MTFEELERLYRTDQKRWECEPYLKNEGDGPKSGYFGDNVRVFFRCLDGSGKKSNEEVYLRVVS